MYTGNMWIYRIIVLAVVVGLRLWMRQDWVGSLWLAVGWIIGMMLAEADHLFYVAVCNPQELTCQRVRREVQNKNWRNAWGILKATSGERVRLPIHNILTGLVVAVLGLWVVSSVGSVLASGVVVGLGVRLFTDFLSQDKKNWFWVFAREFGKREIDIIGGIWGLLLLVSLIGLVR
ncbi:MAG: hypothetical protein UU42_C0024G0002 [Candidatus Woesebacteria bacterium GW2011_GWA1_41_13b]|uniref:Uncharacterized protein n=1 Tax=Candidatus Woesebacteria bacterium GW2011_GWA1_41_13b TaxID=1618555 RepID=A0A0G0UQJ1_9BACT|nr:MAG: hypothetical protein UU42_C0024G0002 [Candidatus Woesebacteria bacterium GW2011_GWA1_41_13b]